MSEGIFWLSMMIAIYVLGVGTGYLAASTMGSQQPQENESDA